MTNSVKSTCSTLLYTWYLLIHMNRRMCRSIQSQQHYAIKSIPDLHPGLMTKEVLSGTQKAEVQNIQHASFISLFLFQSFSKLFISPWCCRKETIMDAKQKVTHIPPLSVLHFLKSFFFWFALQPQGDEERWYSYLPVFSDKLPEELKLVLADLRF